MAKIKENKKGRKKDKFEDSPDEEQQVKRARTAGDPICELEY